MPTQFPCILRGSSSRRTSSAREVHAFRVKIARERQFSTYRFARDNGQAFFGVGENMCWGGGRGSFDYDDWLPELGKAGGNFIRICNIEVRLLDLPPGNYSAKWCDPYGGVAVAGQVGSENGNVRVKISSLRTDIAVQLDLEEQKKPAQQ